MGREKNIFSSLKKGRIVITRNNKEVRVIAKLPEFIEYLKVIYRFSLSDVTSILSSVLSELNALTTTIFLRILGYHQQSKKFLQISHG